MSDAWYAAFGLLTLLSVANALLLVAVMRQVGILHQRVPPLGPGSVGPQPGTTFTRLDLSPVPGSPMNGFGSTPVTVVAYTTPGCGLCTRIPGFLEIYAKTAPPAEQALLSFAVATDAPEPDAERFHDEHPVSVPFVRHPSFKDHYELTNVGAPYLLALTDGVDATANEQLLLAGGIVNSLEQLEDLVRIALDQRLAFIRAASSNGDGSRQDRRNRRTSTQDNVDASPGGQ